MPAGRGLEKVFRTLLDLPETDTSELKDLAKHAVDAGHDVAGLLNDLYIATKVSDDQKTVLQQAWRRIYTTNYDDVAECYFESEGITPRPNSFSITDEPPTKL